MRARSVIIHGHFYQPPREDPWLDEVEAEPSAAPSHDWNQRIEQECYRAVAAARIPGVAGRIARIVNCYAWLSFNFGPTLLEWLERAAPDTYAALLAADRASLARLGHGNAVAMPYHHAILPLSSQREKVTEVRWGIADFRRRFGREPAGMWLPETAVDEATLDVLALAGIKFTILAPTQVKSVPPRGLPGLVRTAAGRSITVCIYDGAISHDVAFGPLVRDAEAWTARMLANPDPKHPPALISVATDGETYGHHHPFGEMALASTLERLRDTPQVTIDNFASFLARHPATHPVTLLAPSSWSCIHGVERWRSDCGCKMAPDPPTQQRWRTPLREAVSWLTAECHALYDREAPAVIEDPARALAEFGSVIGTGADRVRAYGGEVARRPAGRTADEVRATELLEMERGALRTLTSCAWFFDDIGRIETLQVLRYAAWAIELSGSEAARLEAGFTERLAAAVSNQRALGTGRDIYRAQARPAMPAAIRVAAGLAAARLLAPEAAQSPAWELNGPDATALLVNRRTGRRYPSSMAIQRDRLRLTVKVGNALLPGEVILQLHDLAERQRIAVAAMLRQDGLSRLLSTEDHAALLRGESLGSLLRRMLADRVRDLAVRNDEQTRQMIVDLLDLLEEMGQPVPFEAQTLFYTLWRENPSLATLALRFGFDAGSSQFPVPSSP